jgi:hypothetical protein
VREVLDEVTKGEPYRFTKDALLALQEASEAHIVRVLGCGRGGWQGVCVCVGGGVSSSRGKRRGVVNTAASRACTSQAACCLPLTWLLADGHV